LNTLQVPNGVEESFETVAPEIYVQANWSGYSSIMYAIFGGQCPVTPVSGTATSSPYSLTSAPIQNPGGCIVTVSVTAFK
jgi:hypothetical protein